MDFILTVEVGRVGLPSEYYPKRNLYRRIPLSAEGFARWMSSPLSGIAAIKLDV